MAFIGYLRQSTAVTIKFGPFVDETDGATGEGGLTLTQSDIRVSKNGGDYAAKNNATTCTHDELGEYNCPLSTVDTGTLGLLRIACRESGALHVIQDYMVLTQTMYDFLFGSTAPSVAGDAMALSATGQTNVQSALTAQGYTSGRASNLDNLDVAISTRSSHNAANVADSVADEVLTSGTHDVSNSLGRRIREISDSSIILAEGTAQNGTTNTITLASGASSAGNFYKPAVVFIDGGTGAGQVRVVLAYNGTTKVLSVDKNWIINPDSSSTYKIIAASGMLFTGEGILDAATASTASLASGASSVDNNHDGQLLYIVSGTSGVGQARMIESYNGDTAVCTLAEDWVTPIPSAGAGYIIQPAHLSKGIAGLIQDFDTLDTNQDTQHTVTQGLVSDITPLAVG